MASPRVLSSAAVFQLLLFHKALVIETAGKSNRTARSWNCRSTAVGSFLLFISSATMPPSGVLNATTRTPSADPAVSMRVSPGRTNLLKWAR